MVAVSEMKWQWETAALQVIGYREQSSGLEEQLEIQEEILEARENCRKGEAQHLSKNSAQYLVDYCISRDSAEKWPIGCI